ncbi:hypothetical protein I6F07_30485 [Ensifer sp. IC4062]|nr:hypothetical protein [Ensifer sp. IC4062]
MSSPSGNGPVTFGADRNLHSGVIILPDLYVNAGGVAASYFEWVKYLRWSGGRVSGATSRSQPLLSGDRQGVPGRICVTSSSKEAQAGEQQNQTAEEPREHAPSIFDR